ncbi:hypothetical protein J3B01_003303 [Coemansia erecta]|nr:hypothetical protein J3B01_003303 [Coemansia erecta]
MLLTHGVVLGRSLLTVRTSALQYMAARAVPLRSLSTYTTAFRFAFAQPRSAQLANSPSRIQQRNISTLLHGSKSHQALSELRFPRGQQGRGARWEQHTKADYGSKRGNSYRNDPPRRTEITPETVIYLIISINGVVFLMWHTAMSRKDSLGDSKMLQMMMGNFATMWANVREGRIWTLITPAFSHVEPMHLMFNMFMLYSFGGDIAKLLGTKRFVLFYLGAALCGNLVSAVGRGVVLPLLRGDHSGIATPSLGASTSVVGITTLYACLFPTSTLHLFAIIPMPAWVAAVGLIGWDMWRVMSSEKSKTDGAGHLGGAAAALGYYWFRLRPHIRRLR